MKLFSNDFFPISGERFQELTTDVVTPGRLSEFIVTPPLSLGVEGLSLLNSWTPSGRFFHLHSFHLFDTSPSKHPIYGHSHVE